MYDPLEDTELITVYKLMVQHMDEHGREMMTESTRMQLEAIAQNFSNDVARGRRAHVTFCKETYTALIALDPSVEDAWEDRVITAWATDVLWTDKYR